MQQKSGIAILLIALAVAVFTPTLVSAQVPLEDQLKAQYNMVKMGQDSNGAAVIEAGTILSIKKGAFSAFLTAIKPSPPNIRMELSTRRTPWE